MNRIVAFGENVCCVACRRAECLQLDSMQTLGADRGRSLWPDLHDLGNVHRILQRIPLCGERQSKIAP